jgi:hypothetical protein
MAIPNLCCSNLITEDLHGPQNLKLGRLPRTRLEQLYRLPHAGGQLRTQAQAQPQPGRRRGSVALLRDRASACCCRTSGSSETKLGLTGRSQLQYLGRGLFNSRRRRRALVPATVASGLLALEFGKCAFLQHGRHSETYFHSLKKPRNFRFSYLIDPAIDLQLAKRITMNQVQKDSTNARQCEK